MCIVKYLANLQRHISVIPVAKRIAIKNKNKAIIVTTSEEIIYDRCSNVSTVIIL